MNNSILYSYDGNAIKQYDSVTEPGNDYSIINDGSNTTYLLYNANNGDNSQLYLRIYDPSNDTWKQPIALTNTPGYAENFSAAVLGTKVVAMFTRSDVTMAADSMETSTDLYAVVMTPAHDLCLSDVAYDSDSITLGGTLPITLTVKNNGELDETGVVVTVSANGVETQSFTIDTLLNSGDTQQVSIEYVLPNTAAVTEFTFSVTSSSGEEILLDDNSIAKELFLADLSIDVHKLMSDSVSTVLVPVSNIGFVDTNATLYIRRDTEDGEILAQFDMGVIHAGMMQVMEFYDAYIKSLMEGSSSLCEQFQLHIGNRDRLVGFTVQVCRYLRQHGWRSVVNPEYCLWRCCGCTGSTCYGRIYLYWMGQGVWLHYRHYDCNGSVCYCPNSYVCGLGWNCAFNTGCCRWKFRNSP